MIHRIAAAAVLTLGLASAAVAQPAPQPGHPRVNEIDRRLENQADRTNAGVARGQIGPRQAARDRGADARVERQLTRDEAAHNGHITPGEQRRLNNELNRNSNRIEDQRHR